MRNLLAFLLAGLIGGALVFAWSRRTREKETAQVEEARIPTPDREAPAREPAERAPTEREREHPPSDEVAPPALPSALAGTLIVVDENGVEHAEEDGILALGLGFDGARAHREVEVRDGRWSLDLAGVTERKTSMELRGCLVGKRSAVPATGQAAELALPADGQVALRMRWHAGPLLHVRARGGGRELDEVVVYELPPSQRGSVLDARHPGPAARAQARAVGKSPVQLDAGLDPLGPRALFVQSPGHGWGRIEIAPGAEELTLELAPAGVLELIVVGEPQKRALEILLLESAPPHAEMLDLRRGDAGTFVVEDLPAGRYVAQARDYGMLAGQVEVEVRAGERVKAVLEVTPPSTEAVPFEGVLVLPEAWALDDFMLEFLLQGRFDDGSLTHGSFEIRRSEMTLEKGSRERYRWSAPNARAARYRISLYPPVFATELDTGPTGTRDARIEVPPPCVVSLRCVDGDGAGACDDPITILPLTPRVFGIGERQSPRLEYRMPQGRLLIFTTAGAYDAMARVIDAGARRNELLLLAAKKP